MQNQNEKKIFFSVRPIAVFVMLIAALVYVGSTAQTAGTDDIEVTANFTGKTIGRTSPIVLTVSRTIEPADGRIAVMIDNTDVTALFTSSGNDLSYKPELFPFPIGESRVTVYHVLVSGEWKQINELAMKVAAEPEISIADASVPTAPEPQAAASSATDVAGTKFQFTPTITLNVKGQNQTLTFPRESAPTRNPFTDVDGQAGLEFKVARRGWTFTNKFDLVGVGFKQNALRFGELQNEAPMIDLSSYLIELSKDRFKLNMGHVSFGSNRHLINSFSSRGISAVIPMGKQNEITVAAMNGTSIVGYDNFLGITRRKHNVIGLGFAREFIKERPNGLRVEFTVMRGSLLPLANANQGTVNDAERSFGFGFRVKGSDKGDRIRYEAGITRNRFTNPADPQLEQGQTLTAIRETWRTARFAEISFDFLRGLKLWREKKLKLTGTYRHEEIQPLYRSIGASTQADRHQNQFEFTGNFGELTFAFGNLRDRDNLGRVASILKTLNRRSNIIIGLPIAPFVMTEKPLKWLPTISYTFDQLHQFGESLPSNGEFRDPSQVPDQKSFAQAFSSQWTLSETLSFSYRYSRAFQDNRQPGRERADFRSTVNAFSIGTKPTKDLDLDVEIADEMQNNLEQPRKDKTLRLGTRATWRTAFLKNSVFTSGISFSLAGDTGNQNDARNAEFDLQWSYRFAFGKKKFKKLDTQFFIRYSNRYGNTIDRIQTVNSYNKTQAFNFGLSFNIL